MTIMSTSFNSKILLACSLWTSLLCLSVHGFVTPVAVVQKHQHQQRCRRHPSSSFVLATTASDSDSDNSSESSGTPTTPDTTQKDASPNADLRKELDGSFDYNGRLAGADYQNEKFRCGFVSIIGAPNQGKSTILNALLQEDLCIATSRPQTTRHAILGLLTTDDAQVCLVDTPGIIEEPAYKLQEGMMEAVVSAMHDADVLMVVTDLFSTPIPDDELFQKVQASKKPVLVCVNKVDLAARVNVNAEENQDKTVTVEQAVARWRQLIPNALAILPVSASQGIDNPGIVALRTILSGGPDVPGAIRNLGRPVPGMFPEEIKCLSNIQAQALLPISPPLYDSEMLTDRPERFIASEMIRAALFSSLKKELPYCCEVQIESFKEPVEDGSGKKPIIRIAASVFVERDSQKVIVIGKNGQQIKKVGMAAREKLEEFFQTKVRVELSVLSIDVVLRCCLQL